MAPHAPVGDPGAGQGSAHDLTTGFGVGTGLTPNPAPAPAPRRHAAGRRRPGLGTLAACAALSAAGVFLGLAISMGWAAPPARASGRFLDFYCGVFALVALSLAVMVGLLATDRTLLSPAHRVRAQALHRAFALAAVAMLLLHLATQLLRHRVDVMDVLLPAGLGTAAFYLLVIAVGSGIARGRFAATGRPWLWRVLHLTAYAAWPLGIAHGLTTGRDPAPWVTACYLLCLAAVALALIARPFLRRHARRTP